jgi:hypothetical protein
MRNVLSGGQGEDMAEITPLIKEELNSFKMDEMEVHAASRAQSVYLLIHNEPRAHHLHAHHTILFLSLRPRYSHSAYELIQYPQLQWVQRDPPNNTIDSDGEHAIVCRSWRTPVTLLCLGAPSAHHRVGVPRDERMTGDVHPQRERVCRIRPGVRTLPEARMVGRGVRARHVVAREAQPGPKDEKTRGDALGATSIR